MKNRILFFLILLLAGITGFYSCEKDKDATNVRELIVNNIWIFNTIEISDSTNTGLLIASPFIILVYEDSEYDFSDDGTYTRTSDLNEKNGIWELDNNKTLLMDKGTDDETELEILQIDNTTSKLKLHVEGDFFGTPVSGDVILVFKAKQQ